MTETQTLGQRLRASRERLKLSQTLVANRLTPSQRRQNLWAWENDKAEPNVDLLRQLSEQLEVQLCWLMTGFECRARKKRGHKAVAAAGK